VLAGVLETPLTVAWPAAPVRMAAVGHAGVGPMFAVASAPRPVGGDPDALLTTLMSEHVPAMYRVAKVIVRDDALAEDVVQESLLKAWQAAASFRGEASLRSWATRITHNTAVSLLRKRREDLRDPDLLPESTPAPGADALAQDRILVSQLWSALDRLDSVTKAIVVLREVDGLSYDDICDALDLPLPTVKTRLFRARKLLAAELEGTRP
jgi:RNA polymerase sigma-70 factor (ECF subfamily)